MAKVDVARRLDPQMAAALRKQHELAPGIGAMHALSLEAARALYIEERAYWNADAPDLPAVASHTVAGPPRDIPVRIYYPSEAGPILESTCTAGHHSRMIANRRNQRFSDK